MAYQEITIDQGDQGTNGKAQACSFLIDTDSDQAPGSVHSLDISFPIPISLFSGQWVESSSMGGDHCEFVMAPDTVVGGIASDVAINDTEIVVPQSIIDLLNQGTLFTGMWLNLFDGTNTSDLGRILSWDDATDKITVETGSDKAYAAATPTYVRVTTKFVPHMDFVGEGDLIIGEEAIGGSIVPANTVMRAIYHNVTGGSKKFRFIMKYHY
jgi:hypothetical protein